MADHFSESPLGDVKYHDYLALFWHLDAEWSRRKVEHVADPFRSVQRGFEQLCQSFKDGINQNYASFSQANRRSPRRQVAPELFRPAFFVPFGHADTLAAVLVDDFDAVHHLTAGLSTSLEELVLAFCPIAESFGELAAKSRLVNLDVLLGIQADGDSSLIAQRRPLLVFSKFKLDGFGSLGFGIPMQQAAMRAMAQRVALVVKELRASLTAGTLAPICSLKDIDELQWSLLDLQGAEEIGTAMRCTNYTVALAIVSALRSLTYGELLQSDRRLATAFASSVAHRSLVRLYNSSPGQANVHSGVLRSIRENHVFRWTYTSLGVVPEALFHGRTEGCTGKVSVMTDLKIMPGHSGRVAEHFEERQTPKESASAGTPVPPGCLLYKVGASDSLLMFGPEDVAQCSSLISLPDALRQIADMLKQFSTRAGQKGRGRDVLDTRTEIIVPVPRLNVQRGDQQIDLVAGTVLDDHTDILSTILPLLRDSLCMPELNQPATGTASGRLDTATIRLIPKGYGLPVQLRRTIEHLFRNFATLFSDPFLFDVVIDLYDSFATFHRVLTEDLWELRRQELEQQDSPCLSSLSDELTSRIANFADALQNALTHRLLRAYPEGLVRDMAIDFRGGLNQILYSADAILKCGFGLFRNCVLSPDGDVPRDRVGGLTRISFRPGMRATLLSFGQQMGSRLTIVDADVPHVLHVASYCDYLHEAAHVIYDFEFPNRNWFLEKVGCRPGEVNLWGQRIDETFANLVSQMFLFGSDQESFLCYHLVGFAQAQSTPHNCDVETIQQFSEYLLRLFWASDAIPEDTHAANWPERTWHRSTESRKVAMQRFAETCDRTVKFFPDYERLWEAPDSPGKVYCKQLFGDTYRGMASIMPDLWDKARRVYGQHYQRAITDAGLTDADLSQLDVVVAESLRSGRPLVRTFFQGKLCGEPVMDCDRGGLDALLLLCAVLRGYVGRMKESRENLIHLCRTLSSAKASGQVHYPRHPTRTWYPLQVDKGAVSLFCPVPSWRRGRLRQQVTMLKTMWDVASNLRARRMLEILKQNSNIVDQGLLEEDVEMLRQMRVAVEPCNRT